VGLDGNDNPGGARVGIARVECEVLYGSSEKRSDPYAC
jgi:hypothetical protein